MNFEDIVFLFKAAYSNRDRIRMDLDEAVLLWSLVREMEDPAILEIGRWTGGSTILLAAAAGEGGEVVSIDIDPRDDPGVIKLLGTLPAMSKVRLYTGDSKKMTLPNDCPDQYDMVFIDGDHTYEGVKADHERWSTKVKRGGYVVFHDMVETRPDLERGFTTCCPGVNQLYREILEDKRWLRLHMKAGTLAAFEVVAKGD